jgi:hypothetical protein
MISQTQYNIYGMKLMSFMKSGRRNFPYELAQENALPRVVYQDILGY